MKPMHLDRLQEQVLREWSVSNVDFEEMYHNYPSVQFSPMACQRSVSLAERQS